MRHRSFFYRVPNTTGRLPRRSKVAFGVRVTRLVSACDSEMRRGMPVSVSLSIFVLREALLVELILAGTGRFPSIR